MDTDASTAFAAAACPVPARCMGRRLLPLSVGHLVMFHRLDLAWLRCREDGIADLLSGVEICSRNWEECKRWFCRPTSKLRLRLWITSCECRYAITTGKWSRLNFLPSQTIRFREYVHGSLDRFNWPHFIPRTSIQDSELAADQTPEEAMTIANLMTDFGMTETQAMDTPYAFARWLIASNASRNRAGRIELGDSEVVKSRMRRLYEINKLPVPAHLN